MTYNERREAITAAVRRMFPGDAWVEDFDDAVVIIEAYGPDGCVYWQASYSMDADGVVMLDQPTRVDEVTTYVPVGKAVALGGEFTPVSKQAAEGLIFGWASVAVRKDGSPVIDSDGEHVPIAELEPAAYEFVVKYRATGEDHRGEQRGTLVESVVFTKDKIAALGLAEDAVPQGWWVGFRLDDPADFAKIAEGRKVMFSIQGRAVPEKVS